MTRENAVKPATKEIILGKGVFRRKIAKLIGLFFELSPSLKKSYPSEMDTSDDVRKDKRELERW